MADDAGSTALSEENRDRRRTQDAVTNREVEAKAAEEKQETPKLTGGATPQKKRKDVARHTVPDENHPPGGQRDSASPRHSLGGGWLDKLLTPGQCWKSVHLSYLLRILGDFESDP